MGKKSRYCNINKVIIRYLQVIRIAEKFSIKTDPFFLFLFETSLLITLYGAQISRYLSTSGNFSIVEERVNEEAL